jgi:hypothetical protein
VVSDPTPMCELLVGLPAVNVLGVDTRFHLAHLRAAFGGPFPILPRFAYDREATSATCDRTTAADHDSGQGPLAWLARLARVRRPLAALRRWQCTGRRSARRTHCGWASVSSRCRSRGGPDGTSTAWPPR